MPLVKWNEKLSVGVSIIDDEHKNLVEMLNELYDAMLSKKSEALSDFCVGFNQGLRRGWFVEL